MKRSLLLAGVVSVFVGGAPSASASFHFMQIEQVVGGVGGRVDRQAIQLRMRAAGQNIVGASRIRAWTTRARTRS